MKRMLSIALSAALVLSLTGCQKGQEAGGSGSGGETAVGVAVQVTEVEQDTIAAENKVSGQVVTDSETSVFVAANAQCTAVYVEAGDTVSAGQAICTLDMASTLASYNSASISYQASAQSYQDQAAIFDKQIALAEKNVNDLKALFEIGAAAQIEIDQAQLSAVLENVDSRGNVIAPVSGVITSLSAVKDSYVAPSMPVAVIDGADQMKVSVSVSEALIPKLAVGSEADITISALSASFTGEIRTVEQSANPQTRLYTVTLSVPTDIEGLRSGMFADVTFRTDASVDTIVVPTEAILTKGGTQYVFVVENGDTARYVEVQTGLTGSGVTEITSGLSQGDQLVTVGQAYLSDGDPVRVVTGEE